MYLPIDGQLTYLLWQDEMPCSSWACEMCLWTEWIYVGDLISETVSTLISLDVERFCDLLSGAWVCLEGLEARTQPRECGDAASGGRICQGVPQGASPSGPLRP